MSRVVWYVAAIARGCSLALAVALAVAGPGCTRDRTASAPVPPAAPVAALPRTMGAAVPPEPGAAAPPEPGATTPPAPPAPGTALPPTPPVASAPAAPRVPSWKREIAPYFAARCANDRGCHGERPNRHVDLDLRPAAAYRTLVGVYSDERPSAMLVAPGDPEASFVVAKMRGTLRDKEGTAMPRDPEDDRPMKPIPFDPDFIEHALVPWIKAGAPKD